MSVDFLSSCFGCFPSEAPVPIRRTDLWNLPQALPEDSSDNLIVFRTFCKDWYAKANQLELNPSGQEKHRPDFTVAVELRSARELVGFQIDLEACLVSEESYTKSLPRLIDLAGYALSSLAVSLPRAEDLVFARMVYKKSALFLREKSSLDFLKDYEEYLADPDDGLFAARSIIKAKPTSYLYRKMGYTSLFLQEITGGEQYNAATFSFF